MTCTETSAQCMSAPACTACLLEVLAAFRRDARIAMELDEIIEDDQDTVLHRTAPCRQGKSHANG